MTDSSQGPPSAKNSRLPGTIKKSLDQSKLDRRHVSLTSSLFSLTRQVASLQPLRVDRLSVPGIYIVPSNQMTCESAIFSLCVYEHSLSSSTAVSSSSTGGHPAALVSRVYHSSVHCRLDTPFPSRPGWLVLTAVVVRRILR